MTTRAPKAQPAQVSTLPPAATRQDFARFAVACALSLAQHEASQRVLPSSVRRPPAAPGHCAALLERPAGAPQASAGSRGDGGGRSVVITHTLNGGPQIGRGSHEALR